MNMEKLKNEVLAGLQISKEDAMELAEAPLEELTFAANEIRKYFCGNGFDICTIINGKSGRCSEDCKYCAQSAHYKAEVDTYPLLGTDEIVKQAKYNDKHGVLRYSIVTSGRSLNDAEVDSLCESIRAIRKETDMEVCVSLGLMTEAQYRRLKNAGVVRVHNNLETSRSYFPSVCTSHTYENKIAAIRAAEKAGLSICSGGIVGMGETMEDRIDMALTVRDLGVRSVPVNMLNPIPGTPYEKNTVLTNEEMCRIVAVFRFILPDVSIRLAGGRGLLRDKGEKCFRSGANAAISGDMLTTSGITIEKDMELLQKLGFVPQLWKK